MCARSNGPCRRSPSTAAWVSRHRSTAELVVTLLANGSARAEVGVGVPVTLTGRVQVPPGAGKVVKVEWNVTGATGA